MANKIKDALDHIQAGSAQKESTKQFLAESRRKRTKLFYRPAVRRIAAAVCLMVILAAGAGGYAWVQMPVSYLSIDVNPSIELALNRLDKVVAVTAYNIEGEEIIKNLSLKGKGYTEAIDLVIGSEAMGAYLASQEDIVFTLAADSSRESELETGVEGCSGHMGHGCRHVSTDVETVSAAHECGLSLGKYNAYLQLFQYDSSITVEECREMSMSEINRLIKEYEQGRAHHSDTGHSGYDETEENSTSGWQQGNHHQERRHYRGGNHR